MLESIDLSRKVDKAEYKQAKKPMGLRLGALQRRVKDLAVPVIIVFEGWNAAGKGTLINELILPLDPRGYTVTHFGPPSENESLYPFLWRYWNATAPDGQIAIFDRSWYRHVLGDRVEGQRTGINAELAFADIRAFEQQLTDDGTVLVKFFLHISKDTQKKRFKKLRKNSATSWRVAEDDLKRHKRYDEYLTAADEMIVQTDDDNARWTVIEATDHRFATLKIFNKVAATLEQRVAAAERGEQVVAHRQPAPMAEEMRTSPLCQADLSRSLERNEYDDRLDAGQKRLRELEHEIYVRRVPVAIVYEGWDAAGKGGNIRRLIRQLDPRGYEVVPIGAPNDVERAHHYLWRFWRELPKGGHITIFDRSWYGRVLVERVEGFCTPADWRRAYQEINEMERHWANFGMVLLKFWIHIDADEQLRRFEARQEDENKQWKITDEDWRNRQKWDAYEAAVEEMLLRTSTPHAPWTVAESNCKWYARVKVLETVCDAIEKRLG